MEKGITREELEGAIVAPSEKEILALLDDVCPNVWLTNRLRLKLIQRIDNLVTDKIYKAVTGK